MQDQKSVVFLYINNKLSEEERNKIILFTSKGRKYLRITLIKEMRDLYMENYKTLMKETEEDTNKWSDSSCSWIGRINIFKMFILPKAI